MLYSVRVFHAADYKGEKITGEITIDIPTRRYVILCANAQKSTKRF